jgi:hypothetical protein
VLGALLWVESPGPTRDNAESARQSGEMPVPEFNVFGVPLLIDQSSVTACRVTDAHFVVQLSLLCREHESTRSFPLHQTGMSKPSFPFSIRKHKTSHEIRFTPQQSPSDVAGSSAWQRQRGFYRGKGSVWVSRGCIEGRMCGWSKEVSREMHVRDGVGATSDGALAGLAVPDTGRVAADGDLAAESAGVLGVLGDLHLLHLLTQGSTITACTC